MELIDGVLIISTMDTKAEETYFLKDCLKAQNLKVLVLDAGIRGKSPIPVDISRDKVAAAAGSTLCDVQGLGHEGKALNVMISGAIQCAKKLHKDGRIQGLLGLGGSMGTALGTGVMRKFPIGFPKVMISTMASRNTRSFVGTKDIMMLHSVCDLVGLNRVTKNVLREGALAVAGMIKGREFTPSEDRPLAVLSTLGTTEACVVRLRQALEIKGMEVLTFHTVGSGGDAMEELVRDEDVKFVVDLSLHELMDHFFGGDYDAGQNRGKAAPEKGVPTILIPGNTDFLVTGPLETALYRFPGRIMHSHNSAITVVSTEREEMIQLAGIMSDICKKAKGPMAVLIPMGGFSAFDSPDGPMENLDARHALAEALKNSLPQGILYSHSKHHINDPEFASKILDCMDRLLKASESSTKKRG